MILFLLIDIVMAAHLPTNQCNDVARARARSHTALCALLRADGGGADQAGGGGQ